MPAAQWTKTAIDLSDDLSLVAGYLGLTEVCAETNLEPSTIADSLLRPEIDNRENPRGALCRPAARIGGMLRPTPLWSRAQVRDYHERVQLREESRRMNARAELPVLTSGQALQQGLATIEDIARIVPPQVPGEPAGRAEHTMRRYARDYAGTFPPELGITPGRGGPPRGYRNVDAVLRWVVEHERAAGRSPATRHLTYQCHAG